MTAPATARDQLVALAAGDHAWASSWRYAIGTLDPARTRDAAVLVLFGVLDAVPSDHRAAAVARDLDVLLLARAASLGSHAGQVAFPGGRVDPGDGGPVDAALREAVEETGLDAAGVEVIGTFPPLPLPVSHHLVTPVLGWWARPTPVHVVDVGESAHVFRVPVADLVDPENRRTVVARRGPRAYRSPGFVVTADGRDHLVWGFTAGILDAVLDRLGWAEPWDRDRTVDAPL
ncbi:coenzyme A pyrophosphatase [Luteimicrobium album]|uniref:Coenzyme A pyrophosphatase n=1 Tax=Luteimicrobium album TaxID=1054550 RepID=A0ABQ6I581_9MICO|nr:coenzyme A pyrophosphatase [Luteimicrobium album]